MAFFATTEADTIGAARITPVRQEQLQARLGERFRELDVPLLVRWPDGRREALLFVLEEESDARRYSIHRLAHYCLDLAELMETERVVPVVIFLRQASSVAQRLNLPNMQYPAGRKVEVYAQAVRGLTGLERDPEKQLKCLDFIDIYAALDDNERVKYQRDYPDEAKTMSRFAERFREEGIQQGVQQGKHQGEALVLERLLRLKFGALPDETQRRIEQASEQTLLTWSERVLTANRFEEVFH